MATGKTKRARAITKPTGAIAVMYYEALVAAIAEAHNETQRQAAQAVNVALTLRNWLVGYYIVEYEQHGNDCARYGERLLDELARDLKHSVGKGFTKRYLEIFRRFYLHYPIAKSLISQLGIDLHLLPSVSISTLDWQNDKYFARLLSQLPWTHFIELIRMDDPLKRAFYEVETLKNRWSVRELKRPIGSLLYERVGLSRDKEGVLSLAKDGELVTAPADVIRDPYVFEFLGLKREDLYTESQMERALLDHLQEFLLEMGKGFCCKVSGSARWKRAGLALLLVFSNNGVFSGQAGKMPALPGQIFLFVNLLCNSPERYTLSYCH